MINTFKSYIKDQNSVGYLIFDDFNPPVIAHQTVMDEAAKSGTDYKIFASQIVESESNPLNYHSKIKFMRKVFTRHARNIILDTSVSNFLESAAYMYNQGYKNLVVTCDNSNMNLLEQNNGVKGNHGYYDFYNITQIEKSECIEESVQLESARSNNFAAFAKNIPTTASDVLTKELFNAVRKGLNLDENKKFSRHVDLEPVSERREEYVSGELFHSGQQVIVKESDEVVTITHCGSNYVIVEADGKKTRKWLTDVEPLEERVSQDQINSLEKFADKLLAKYDIDIEFTRHFVDRVNDARNNPEIKVAELQKFFKKVQKAKGNKIKTIGDFQAVLKDVTTDLNIPAVIRNKGDDFEVTLKTIMRKKNFKTPNKIIQYENKVAQDPDVKDKKGTQPKKYFSGLAKSTKSARDAHFKKGAKMDDDSPAAYTPAPGDKEGETKPSKHTKKYKQMYGEGDGLWANINKKRKEGRPMRKPGSKGAPTTQDFKNARGESIEEAKIEGLVKKAEKSGISYGILKQVYNRGMAAWRTGHRPGTTPQQWAFARVNSFLTGGKTRRTADKDLWAKTKK